MTAPPSGRQMPTVLDQRIETAVGYSLEELRRHRDGGLLDAPHAALADAHRDLVAGERDVTFYRVRLARLASSELPVDQALFARIDRTLDQLAKAADVRDAKQTTAAAALEAIEAAAPRQAPRQVATQDVAALLAIAQGAKLHEHLVTHRLAVATPSRTRISYAQLQRLEAMGLVERDTAHPVQGGQPVTLTDAGRAALTAPRRAGPPGTTPCPCRRPSPLSPVHAAERRVRAARTAPQASRPKAPMPSYEPDFRLDGYEAVNDHVADQFWGHIGIEQDMMTVLAEHHSDDAEHSFYLMHNGAVTWGIPGEPQIVALHLKRDPATRTYRFAHEELPLPSMAQSWLIARGCPEEKILLPGGMGTTLANEATRALEQRLRSDGDHFALLTSYTHDSDPIRTTVMLRALDEKAALPFRVLLEEVDSTAWTHTLREGGFETFEAATQWWEAHWNGERPPLPATRLATAVPGLPARPALPRGPSR